MSFRNILSKPSLQSPSSSCQTFYQAEEIIKLQNEIETLNNNILALKKCIENRDVAINVLAREKEKLYFELKSSQKTNRNLHQQLIDERDIHSKEKEYLIEDLKRLSKRHESDLNLNSCIQLHDDNDTPPLQEQIKVKDEIICNICAKYLKIRSNKINLKKKLIKLQMQSQKICETVILTLEENKQALVGLLNNLLRMPSILPKNKKFIQLLKINAKLHFENTQLKILMSAKKETNDIKELSLSSEKTSKICVIKKFKTRKLLRVQKSKILGARHSYPMNTGQLIDCKGGPANFSAIYDSLSPYFRKKVRRSKSETDLDRF